MRKIFYKAAVLALVVVAGLSVLAAFCLAPISFINLVLLSGGVAVFNAAERIYKARLATGK